MSEHPCAACARHVGRTCCEPDEPHGLATLTRGDVDRIRAATRKSARHFVDEEVFTPEEAHAHAQLRPANRFAVVGGVRRHLRARGGACVFHRQDVGCTLPADARPLACRLYPFELDAFDRLTIAVAGRCHAEETRGALPDVLQALGTSEREVRALHARLLGELESDARSIGE